MHITGVKVEISGVHTSRLDSKLCGSKVTSQKRICREFNTRIYPFVKTRFGPRNSDSLWLNETYVYSGA